MPQGGIKWEHWPEMGDIAVALGINATFTYCKFVDKYKSLQANKITVSAKSVNKPFKPIVFSYTSWKHYKASGFPMFSGGTEKD